MIPRTFPPFLQGHFAAFLQVGHKYPVILLGYFLVVDVGVYFIAQFHTSAVHICRTYDGKIIIRDHCLGMNEFASLFEDPDSCLKAAIVLCAKYFDVSTDYILGVID